MDVVKLLNTLTGGHLLEWKVLLASVVFLLAGVQVLMAARFYERIPLTVSGRTAARVHRWSGRTAVALAVVVGFSCLAGPAGPLTPARVVLHSVFGTLVFVLLASKYLVLKIARRSDRLLPYIGTGIFLSFAALWATSVADYITAR
jgi:Family of unknown function (DUF6529)